MTSEGTYILWDVVEEHLDEAEFLFEQWDRAVTAPDLCWSEVERAWGGRLRAHLDGLAIAGPSARTRLLRPALFDEGAEASRRVAAALALIEQDEFALVLEALSGAAALPRESAARALVVTARSGLDDMLLRALSGAEGALQWRLVDVLAARGVDLGAVSADLLAHEEPEAQRAGLRAARGNIVQLALPRVMSLLDAQDPVLRAHAREASLRSGSREAWERCVREAWGGDPDAMLWVAMLGGVPALELLEDALGDDCLRAVALRGLGVTGLAAAAPLCLRSICEGDGATAKLAADAFGALTGVDARCEGFGALTGVDDALPPLADDLAQDLSLNVLDALQAPVPERFEVWWSERGQAFSAGARYARGAALGSVEAGAQMEGWPMRVLGPLRSELGVREGGCWAALRIAPESPWGTVKACANELVPGRKWR